MKSSLWINGQRAAATMIWISETHAEVIVDEAAALDGNRLTALVLRDFLSLPARVEVRDGRHVVLRFVQTPHSSVIELLREELICDGIELVRDALEEAAMPANPQADLEAWNAQSGCAAERQRAA